MIKLVPNWKQLLKSWVIWAAGFGIVIPDLLQLIADNTDLLWWFDAGYKSGIRLACLVAIVVLRPIYQPSLHPEPPHEADTDAR
jgi:hypothetical protein